MPWVAYENADIHCSALEARKSKVHRKRQHAVEAPGVSLCPVVSHGTGLDIEALFPPTSPAVYFPRSHLLMLSAWGRASGTNPGKAASTP